MAGRRSDRRTTRRPAPEPAALDRSAPEAQPSKLELDSAFAADAPTGRIPVIVKVAEDEYVPAGVEVRARISARLFTAQVDTGDLPRLEHDSRVVSVSVAKPIRPV